MEFFYLVGSVGADKYGECLLSIRLELLDMFGRGYVIDHCISTLKKEKEETLFRYYVTDSLTNIATFVAQLGSGKYEVPRYADMIQPPKEEKEERTADEIIVSISDKLANL